MLGALLGFGIQPGPRLYQTNPEIFWSVIMSMYIGMVVLLIKFTFNPLHRQNFSSSKKFFNSINFIFSITGIYLISFNNFDIYLMIGIALLATFFGYMTFQCHL